jgi:hypothetical protein
MYGSNDRPRVCIDDHFVDNLPQLLCGDNHIIHYEWDCDIDSFRIVTGFHFLGVCMFLVRM